MRRLAGVLVLAVLLSGAAGAQDAPEPPVEIVAISTRADLVTGGDVLLELRGAPGAVVDIDGRDVSAAFAQRADGRVLGLVDGLAPGRSVVTATLADGSGATLELDNHALGGPLFAGPQVQPWVCTTEAAGLGAPQDERCSVDPVVTYAYLPEGGTALAPYDRDDPPSGVATTTTDAGTSAPFVVRVEKGSMDRGVYGFAALVDPAAPDEPWAHTVWDHKATANFGGDCTAQHQQAGNGIPMNAETIGFLGRGFAVLSHQMLALGANCNEVVGAEALTMLRERVAETLGEIRYTLGRGCSGGSMMQLTIANAYPGLLDGLFVQCTYADQWTTWAETIDCSLLVRYFTQTSPQLWPVAEQRARVAGHATASTCALWDQLYDNVVADPRGAQCVPASQEWAYDPAANPEGTRCALADYQGAIWGPRPAEVWGPVEQAIGRGFARRPLDSVGVQYGLVGLQSGAILPEQFVDLNARIGGYDIDMGWQPGRTAADPGAAELAYRAGRVTQGHHLDRVAIIDVPGQVPAPVADNLEFHTAFRSRMLRERLIAANGHADNHAIARGGRPDAVDVLDAWLAAVVADGSDASREEKIARHRPSAANDDCIIAGERISDEATCAAAFPFFADPRIAAGGPTTDDVLQCQLEPLRRDDPDYATYGVTFSDAQWQRLQAAFTDGVCDYAQPGLGDQPVVPWLTYAEGPGGRPLGDPPVSAPFGPDGAAATVQRFGGATRVETAVAVVGAGVEQADSVVLATSATYADALAGAPLAVHLEAPLLLTPPGALAPAVAEELGRLGASRAVLLGGEAALSQRVAADLAALGLDVRRVAGANRYATAAVIAGELPDAGTALLARGDAFPDALSASGLGAATTTPVLLAEPGRLPPETAGALRPGLDVTIVGGAAAIGAAVAGAVDDAAGAVDRLAGDTRFGTSAAVADAALAAGLTPAVTWVATGSDFPDALVAGAAAGRDRGVLVLVDGTSLDGSPETRDWLARHLDAIAALRIAGGTAAVSEAVEVALRATRAAPG